MDRAGSRIFSRGVVNSNTTIVPRSKAVCTPVSNRVAITCRAGRTCKVGNSGNTRILLRVKVSAIGLGNRGFASGITRKRHIGGNSILKAISLTTIGGTNCSPAIVIVIAGAPGCGSIIEVSGSDIGRNRGLVTLRTWEGFLGRGGDCPRSTAQGVNLSVLKQIDSSNYFLVMTVSGSY